MAIDEQIVARRPGIIRFGEAAPVLQQLHARMRVRELYSDDLPAAHLRLLYGLPDETPVASRVDQLSERNSAKSRKSDVLGADEMTVSRGPSHRRSAATLKRGEDRT
jgi:hypothetical protein